MTDFMVSVILSFKIPFFSCVAVWLCVWLWFRNCLHFHVGSSLGLAGFWGCDFFFFGYDYITDYE